MVRSKKKPRPEARAHSSETVSNGLVASDRNFRHRRGNQAPIWRRHQATFHLVQFYPLDIPGQTQGFERPDAVPVHVDFIPPEAVLRCRRMRVVIVVPAFAKCQQRHPPAIGGKVARREAPRTPGVRRRIHQPGRVQSNHGAQERFPTAATAGRRSRTARLPAQSAERSDIS